MVYESFFSNSIPGSKNNVFSKCCGKSFDGLYILPLSSPGKITGLYIYRRKIFLLCLMPCKEKIPREEGFLGGIILQKMGLGNLLGEVS